MTRTKEIFRTYWFADFGLFLGLLFGLGAFGSLLGGALMAGLQVLLEGDFFGAVDRDEKDKNRADDDGQ